MIIKEDIYIKPFKLRRTLHIFVPDGLEENQKCDVIYMFDGHNLFNDEDATYGTSWGLSEDIQNKKIPIMIVGIECNHKDNQRLFEFSPYRFYDKGFGIIKGRGDKLIQWMVEYLKPYIDSKYPTFKEREHTAIGGSSMGGLMALYAGIKYSNVYKNALCLSPYIYYVNKEILKDIKKNDINADTNFYISFGSEEVQYKWQLVSLFDNLFSIQRALEEKAHVKLHVYKNEKHCEASWRKETNVWLKELKYEK